MPVDDNVERLNVEIEQSLWRLLIDARNEAKQMREALEFEVNANNTMSSLITQISDENERLRATLKLVTEHPSHTDGYANSAQHCESCAEIMETINDLRG